MKTVIFDIDGTLANIEHRLHHIEGDKKDWDGFHKECHLDTTYPKIIEMTHIMRDAGYRIVMCTGRGEQNRQATEKWLVENEIPCVLLLMRAEGNFESDFIIKRRMVGYLIEEGHDIHYAFEDRDRVVEMYREIGITCFQVKKGDY